MSPGPLWLLAALGIIAFSSRGLPSFATPTVSKMGPAGSRSSSSVRAECPGCLLAGAASEEITLPAGVPLAGYGGLGRRLLVPDLLGLHPYAFWFKPSQGVHLPIMARALVLERGAVRVLWIAVDLVGVDSRLVRDLRSRLASERLGDTALIVAASHTHSGPGGFARSGFFGFLALDRFVPQIADHLLEAMVRVARQAELKKTPAQIGSGSGVATGLTSSRLGLPLDPEVGVLKVVAADGSPRALLWNFAVHGTALGKDNLRLSGDLMGIAAQRLERTLGVPALYTNGAVADVNPARHGPAAAEELGATLARQVLAVWERVSPQEEAGLSTLVEAIHLPKPRLVLRNCAGRWIPRSVSLGLGWALPEAGELVAVRTGAHAWVAIPGELETRLGQEVKAVGRRFFQGTFVVGLANGYLGYFLTREAYRQVGYIQCASLYGETAGEVVTERAKALLRRLGESRP